MPVFIDEVVFRGEVTASRAAGSAEAAAGAGGGAGPDRDALIAEVSQAVIDHLERALERIGER